MVVHGSDKRFRALRRCNTLLTLPRAFTVFALCSLLLSGCLDQLVSAFIPVYAEDGEPGFADFKVDFDGLIPEELSLRGLSPDHGPFVGGTMVTLFGSGFTSKTTVRIGGKQIQVGELKVLSPITIQLFTPAGQVGPADVEVIEGSTSTKLEGGYTYDPVYLDPASGPTVGGTLVTLIGQGIVFSEPMTVLLDGAPLTELEVVSASLLRGRTPPGADGPADLTLSLASGDQIIQEAFTYYSSTDPKSGGLGGGPIAGSLTVSVLNWMNRQPLIGAHVVVQQGRFFTYTQTTDTQGISVFTAPDLQGPVTVTAALAEYETSTIVDLDARDVTIFLMPIIEPSPGPIPPGPLPGTVTGHVLFGGSVGVGSTQWKIVPSPKENQVKRTYVFLTAPSMEWGPQYPTPSATIDFTDTGNTAWPYTISGRTGGMAVYAIAGLYHQLNGSFIPYAMGITRGLVVGPGEVVDADVLVNIPLTEKVTVHLENPPPGFDEHQVRLAIILGGDGVMMRTDHDVQGAGVFVDLALSKLPSFGYQGLFDAAYAVDVTLQSGTEEHIPYVRAVERSVQPQDGVILLEGFVGPPQQVKPAPGGFLEGNTLMWSSTGLPPSLAVSRISFADQTAHWMVISPGDVSLFKLPDPATFGLPAWPTGTLVWQQWLAHIPDFDFDVYTYRHLSSSTWDRWSFHTFAIKVP